MTVLRHSYFDNLKRVSVYRDDRYLLQALEDHPNSKTWEELREECKSSLKIMDEKGAPPEDITLD